MRIKFYSTFKPVVLERINGANTRTLIPSVDSFIQRFSNHYRTEESFRQSLIVQLLHAFMAKMEGATNPHYGAKVLNFMLALASGGNSKAFEFVSANFCSVSLRHIARLTAQRRSEPFINLSKADMIGRIRGYINKFRANSGSTSSKERVAMTIGIDATVLIKAFQVCHCTKTIVGGAYPNHSLRIIDDMAAMLKDCVDGKKYGEPAAEVKVCVVSLQGTPTGMCPYFPLVGRPQSVNENSSFGKMCWKHASRRPRRMGMLLFLTHPLTVYQQRFSGIYV